MFQIHDDSPFVLLSSPGMHRMGDSISEWLAEYDRVFPHYRVEYEEFKNGEFLPVIPHTVRRQHVFFLHPLQFPNPNAELIKLLLTADALKRAAVSGITLVIPYIPYLRQDRRDMPRVPISARVIADLIESNKKVDRIITVDMHVEQEEGFFSIPLDNLSSIPLMVQYFKDLFFDDFHDVLVIAPDLGSAKRSRRLAKKMGDLPVSIVEKRRPRPNESEILTIIGDRVFGRRVVVFDDMLDTGTTIRNTIEAVRNHGARDVHLSITHGIFSGDAVNEFRSSGFKVACTDSIPREDAFYTDNPWLVRIPIAPLLAEVILESSLIGGSVSKISE